MKVINLEITKEEKENIYLYPIYKMLSWDLLFYYSISFLFLTQIKHISAADVLLGEAFYPAFRVIFLLPLTTIIAKLGKKKSIIIANLINACSVLSYIMAKDFSYVLLGQFFSAIAFNIKGVVESNLLYDNLPRGPKRGLVFSKIDGSATSWYYYIDAVTSIASGFLYVINGYIPLILCFICCLISAIIAFKFKETEKDLEMQQISTKKYVKDLKNSIKYMIQSNRLKYLLIFGGMFSGILTVLITLRSGILKQIGVQEQYFGVIFAVLEIIAGISARNQERIHEKYRNKTLGVLAIPTVMSCILIGLFVEAKFAFVITIIFILIMYFIQYVARGPYYTLIKRYLNNFTDSSLRNKISSIFNLLENIMKTLIALIASFLLRITTASGTILVIGCLTTIAIVLLLDKMRGKVGLKPEEYKKEEIEFLQIR